MGIISDIGEISRRLNSPVNKLRVMKKKNPDLSSELDDVIARIQEIQRELGK